MLVSAAQQFAERLKTLRVDTGRSQREVGQQLAGHGGENVTGSAVGEWERGTSRPDRRNALALDRLFELPEGTLSGLLGYSTIDLDYEARLAAMEERFSRIEEALARLEKRQRR